AAVEELVDAGLLGQEAAGPDEEPTVLERYVRRFRGDLQDLLLQRAVHRVVVLAVQEGVVDPGDAGLGRVDAHGDLGRLQGIGHRFTSRAGFEGRPTAAGGRQRCAGCGRY